MSDFTEEEISHYCEQMEKIKNILQTIKQVYEIDGDSNFRESFWGHLKSGPNPFYDQLVSGVYIGIWTQNGEKILPTTIYTEWGYMNVSILYADLSKLDVLDVVLELEECKNFPKPGSIAMVPTIHFKEDKQWLLKEEFLCYKGCEYLWHNYGYDILKEIK